jgi:hypothetical protein
MQFVGWKAVGADFLRKRGVLIMPFETMANGAKGLELAQKQGRIASMWLHMISRLCG